MDCLDFLLLTGAIKRSISLLSILLRAIMNKDQVKGTVKNISGKVQQEAAKLAGSPNQQAKGVQKQILGKAQKNLGDAKQSIKDAASHL